MANAIKIDPTRTVLLRRAFVADMVRRFKALSREIQQLIVNDDAFGLHSPGVRVVSDLYTVANVEFQAWRFQTNPQKVKSYRRWLQQQIDGKILTQVGGVTSKPWTATYIEPAYQKGVVRAYTDSRKELLTQSEVFGVSQAEFLRTSFSGPVALAKIELLYERAFTELEGVTAAMDQQMSRILAGGLAEGHGAAKIARNLRDNVTKMTNTRAKVIARTEIVRAHAEGQLDSFEMLGVKKLGVQAEWITAGDDRVCAICADLEGQVFSVKEARGLIPEHPNCRCAWIPANVGEKTGIPTTKRSTPSIPQVGPTLSPKQKAASLKPQVKKQPEMTPAQFDNSLTPKEEKMLISWVESEGSSASTGDAGWITIRELEITAPKNVRVKDWNTILDRAPKYKERIYRGGLDNKGDAFNDIYKLKEGQTFTIDSSSSSTSGKKLGDIFLENHMEFADNNEAYLLRIQSKTGADVRKTAKRLGEWDEKEVILRSGSKYRVDKITSKVHEKFIGVEYKVFDLTEI